MHVDKETFSWRNGSNKSFNFYSSKILYIVLNLIKSIILKYVCASADAVSNTDEKLAYLWALRVSCYE